MNRQNTYGALVLSALGAIVGCTSAEYDGLPERVKKLEEIGSKQTQKISDLETENEQLRSFYNDYRARLDTTPENLASHEFDEGMRYASIRLELLTIRRALADEQAARTGGDTAAITTATRYADTKLAELEQRLRGYVDTETKARISEDAGINTVAGTQNITITTLRTRLERAEQAIVDLQRAEERRALDAASREARK